MLLTYGSQRAMEAIRRLSNTDQGFNDILDWLRLEREKLVEESVVHNDVRARQCQGGFMVLDDLFERVEASKKS